MSIDADQPSYYRCVGVAVAWLCLFALLTVQGLFSGHASRHADSPDPPIHSALVDY